MKYKIISENSSFYFILIILIVSLISIYVYQTMCYYYELNLIDENYNKIEPNNFLNYTNKFQNK